MKKVSGDCCHNDRYVRYDDNGDDDDDMDVGKDRECDGSICIHLLLLRPRARPPCRLRTLPEMSTSTILVIPTDHDHDFSEVFFQSGKTQVMYFMAVSIKRYCELMVSLLLRAVVGLFGVF